MGHFGGPFFLGRDERAEGRSITVIDDGCGMDETNAKRALLRSSTSKIRDFEDLESLITRGFRGEAIDVQRNLF